MPRSQRQQSEVQVLNTTVRIAETVQGFEISFEITGTEGVPVAIELGFREGGTLEGVSTLPEGTDRFILREGYGTYRYEGSKITFGPGTARHSWTQLRGALPKLPAHSVYLTGFTPFTHRLSVS